jgi:hypothetical protein
LDLVGAFAHASEAEMPDWGRLGDIKAVTIVFDFQGEAIKGIAQIATHMGGFAMAVSVVERLASYAEKVFLRCRPQDKRFAFD